MTDTRQLIQKGKIFKIQKYCLHDGPGIRTTLFFQGCPLKCQWCHNPESQSFLNKPDQNCPDQTDGYSVDHIINEIEKDCIFYDQSQGGVTFSGGEPLSQPGFLFSLLYECNKREIHTCVDTSGYSSLDVFKEMCQKTDMVLFDLKLIDNDMHKKYTNVPLTTILDNLNFISKKDIPVIIRIPLIPGITDKDKNIDGIISLLSDLKKFKDVNLLPFHNTGEAKYKRLGMKNHLKGVKPCSILKINQIKQRFTDHGFDVIIGR